MKSIWKFFTSVKLAIILIILIAAASVLGTLIPQQRSLAEYAARYGSLAKLFIRLQLVHVYHSFWYLALLFLFALNIIICTLARLSPKVRRVFSPRLETEGKNILTLKIKDRFKKNADLARTKEELKKRLVSCHYRLRVRDSENKIFLLARKKILGWFGADIVHTGLLVILAGGFVSGLGGFREYLAFNEGQTLFVPRAKFELRLDKFKTEYYPDGSIKDWKSTLTVIENRSPLMTKTVEVNHPLSYRRFSFYQTSYGWNWENPVLEIWVKKRMDPGFLKKIEINVGERFFLQDEANIQISVLRFIPDFVLDEANEAQTRSLEPNNPAALIEGWQAEEKIFSGWIFARFPDMARIHSSQETDLSFELKNFKASQFSVIEVARDPGVNLIWVGSILLMAGLFLAFYWPAREIRVMGEESQDKTEVLAGGISSRSPEAFQVEFEKIMASLRRGE